MSLKMNLSLSLPDVDNAVQTGDPTHRRNCLQLSQLFKKLANGNLPVDRVGSCHAYGTVQFTGTAAAAQTVTINNTVVSQTGSGTADTDAASMAAAINANAVLSKLVVARAAAATDLVTIQAKKAGAAGNYSLSCTGQGLTASGTALTLGSDQNVLDLRTSAVNASGYMYATSALSGAVGATIGGTTVTDTAAGGDNQTLKLVATAINANTTVNKWVRARTVPLGSVNLITTTADVVTVTVNGVACSATGLDTDEDVTGPLLVTAINALTSSHGCIANYVASTDVLYVVPADGKEKVELAVSGAGAGGSTIGGHASEYYTLTATDAGAVTLPINGVSCTITAGGTEDTDGAALVVEINRLVNAHGCLASYNSGTNVLTITSKAAGSAGNQISLGVASGAGATTVTRHGALLTGGTDACQVFSRLPGVIGNAIGLVASGTNAIVSGSVLSGGSESRVAYAL